MGVVKRWNERPFLPRTLIKYVLLETVYMYVRHRDTLTRGSIDASGLIRIVCQGRYALKRTSSDHCSSAWPVTNTAELNSQTCILPHFSIRFRRFPEAQNKFTIPIARNTKLKRGSSVWYIMQLCYKCLWVRQTTTSTRLGNVSESVLGPFYSLNVLLLQERLDCLGRRRSIWRLPRRVLLSPFWYRESWEQSVVRFGK